MNNPLEHIMGVEEAGELWGLSPDHVKRLCRDGDINAKKIGKTWVIDKNQLNPKGGKRMRKEETFTVVVEEEYEAVAGMVKQEIKSKEVENEEQAIELAKKWANEHKNDYIYINYYRAADGQHGFLNPDGYGITGQDWAEEYK